MAMAIAMDQGMTQQILGTGCGSRSRTVLVGLAVISVVPLWSSL
jgi:hypothetical protein